MLVWPFLSVLLLRMRSRWPVAEADWLDWMMLLLAAVSAYAAFDSLRRAMRQARAGRGGLSSSPSSWLPPIFFRAAGFRWGIAYALLALALGFKLFDAPEHRPLCWLASVGAIALLMNLAIVRGRAERSLAGELFGALTLSLAMPASLVLAFGAWQRGFAGLWTLTFLFNASGILYARLCREAIVNGLDSPALQVKTRQLASFLLASFAILAVQLIQGGVGWTGTLSMMPMWLMIRAGIRNPRMHASVKALGFTLLGQSVLIAALLGLVG